MTDQPHSDYPTEAAVLATIASYPEAAAVAIAELDVLWDEIWTTSTTATIAAAVRQLIQEHRVPDWLNLRAHLLRHDEQPAVLDDIRQFAEAPQLLRDRCQSLRDAARSRRLQAVAATIANPGTRSADDLTREATAMLLGVQAAGMRAASSREVAREALDVWTKRHANPQAVTGVPFPWHPLNSATQGMQPGTLTILGARPSHGKTAIAVTIANYCASLGYPVLFVSHEMTNRQLFLRMASLRGGIGFGLLDSASAKRTSAIERWLRSNEEIAGLPITWVDQPGLPPSQYQAQALTIAHQHATDEYPLLCIIDYLQLEHLPDWRGGTRTDELARISSSWIATSRRAPIALLALAQLNRGAAGIEPTTSQLRDSGALEQDAHSVLLLYRKGMEDESAPANRATLNLGKNRNGPLRRLNLHWDGYTMTYREWLETDKPLSAADISADCTKRNRLDTGLDSSTPDDDPPEEDF